MRLARLISEACSPRRTRLGVASGTAALVRVELSKDIAGIDADEEFTQGNPHFWLNPEYVTTYTTIIRDTLSQLDPAGAAVYQANATRYGATLTALDTELQTQAATIPEADRKMVTNHDAFPYFAQRYGFTIVGNILNSDEAELSAGDLAALVEKLRSAQVKAIFAESQFNQNVSQTLARETGINVIATLYTDSLGTSEAATYVDMMRYNMRTIVHALTGTR